MPIEFRPETEAWRRPGRPKVEIPQELAEALERTYAEGTVGEDEADEDSPATKRVIALMRLYCKRKNKIFESQFFDRDGRTWLRFKMRDPRHYTKTLVGPSGRTRR